MTTTSRCGHCGGDAHLLQVIDRPQQDLVYIFVCDCGRWWRRSPSKGRRP